MKYLFLASLDGKETIFAPEESFITCPELTQTV